MRIKPLAVRRLAEPFEALRASAEAHAARTGAPAKIFLACVGDLASHGARAKLLRGADMRSSSGILDAKSKQ